MEARMEEENNCYRSGNPLLKCTLGGRAVVPMLVQRT